MRFTGRSPNYKRIKTMKTHSVHKGLFEILTRIKNLYAYEPIFAHIIRRFPETVTDNIPGGNMHMYQLGQDLLEAYRAVPVLPKTILPEVMLELQTWVDLYLSRVIKPPAF